MRVNVVGDYEAQYEELFLFSIGWRKQHVFGQLPKKKHQIFRKIQKSPPNHQYGKKSWNSVHTTFHTTFLSAATFHTTFFCRRTAFVQFFVYKLMRARVSCIQVTMCLYHNNHVQVMHACVHEIYVHA